MNATDNRQQTLVSRPGNEPAEGRDESAGYVAPKPRMLFFVGADGSGKSTLARFAVEELKRRGERAVLAWSRYNNYFSKPMLALARFTGHNYYETHDGIRFGYHDFARTPLLKYPFLVAQLVDVNIATAMLIRRVRKRANVIVFERGPWDTLADLILDTGCQFLGNETLARIFTKTIRSDSRVLWVSRAEEAILRCRPELRYDRSFGTKMRIYRSLAERRGWQVIDNNRALEEVKNELCQLV